MSFGCDAAGRWWLRAGADGRAAFLRTARDARRRAAQRAPADAGAGHAAGCDAAADRRAGRGRSAADPARPAPAGRQPGRRTAAAERAERRGDAGGAGLPLTSNGTVFSFADLAASLLDSVVYISTSQRVTMSGRTPTPDGENEDGDSDNGDKRQRQA